MKKFLKVCTNILYYILMGILISFLITFSAISIAVSIKAVDVAYDNGGYFSDLINDLADTLSDENNYSKCTKSIVANAAEEPLYYNYSFDVLSVALPIPLVFSDSVLNYKINYFFTKFPLWDQYLVNYYYEIYDVNNSSIYSYGTFSMSNATLSDKFNGGYNVNFTPSADAIDIGYSFDYTDDGLQKSVLIPLLSGCNTIPEDSLYFKFSSPNRINFNSLRIRVAPVVNIQGNYDFSEFGYPFYDTSFLIDVATNNYTQFVVDIDDILITETSTPTYTHSIPSSQVSFNDGYNQGYNSGYSAGNSAGINSGFEQGREEGYNQGYTIGKNQGFNDGVTSANDYSFLSMLTAVVDAPVSVFSQMFDFNVLGFNMTTFFFSMLTLCLVIAIIKRLL